MCRTSSRATASDEVKQGNGLQFYLALAFSAANRYSGYSDEFLGHQNGLSVLRVLYAHTISCLLQGRGSIKS